MKTEEKLRRLRDRMHTDGIDAYIVPGTDSHQSEYVAPHFQVRHWLSGFYGSAGTVVVTPEEAGLWTDSRYYIEAEQALEGSGIELFRSGEPEVPDYPAWLAQTLPGGSTVGFDGELFSVGTVRELHTAFAPAGLTVEPTGDLVGELWEDRPAMPTEPAFLIPDDVAGESRRQKLTRLREAMRKQGADHHFLASLDDIAWLFNLRGGDIPYNPLVLAYAVVTPSRAQLFIDQRKLADVDKHQLREAGVDIASYESIRGYLETLPDETTLLIDPNKVSKSIHRALPERIEIVEAQNPTSLMKACKNDTELDGTRQAMLRDGVALVRFWHWLENAVGTEEITEADAGDRLYALRAEQPEFRGSSFHAIVGYNENGAIIHYAAAPGTAKTLEEAGTLLVDSGGHYSHGTTDVTRVIPLGPVAAGIRTDYTLVLKAHIALATAYFPRGTTGHQLDAITRNELWKHGLNYGHGTGHGVGFFLNVHEGPQGLGSSPNGVALKPGMIVSNEPGHYRAGKWGIRIENLVAVRASAEPEEHASEEFYELETLTLCPIDTSLIETELLTEAERRWINAYHERVYKALAAHLKPELRAWLLRKTEQI